MKNKAFTLIELLVVILILALLSTIAVGVFTTQVERARVAAAQATISTLELGVERYQIDVGEYPPSGSGPIPYSQPSGFSGNTAYDGCGYLQVCLVSSLSGKSTQPASVRWQGPYVTVKNMNLGDISGIRVDDPSRTVAVAAGQVQILDPYQSPYRYVRSRSVANPTTDVDRYANNGGSLLPPLNGFAATETYYNPSTFQISSKGPDGVTGNAAVGAYGTGVNDISNFGL